MAAPLPRRDIWLLPLIAFATLLILVIGSEVAARAFWPEQTDNPCMRVDPVLGIHYRPNCAAILKTAEGPWYESRYNNCGYRSDHPCGPLPAGHRRIALLGTSISAGYLVAYPDTIGARLEQDLSRMCAQPVEVQNLGSLGYFGPWLLPRMDEALRLKPDMVVLVITPFDLEVISDIGGSAKAQAEPAPQPASLQHRLVGALKDSRAVAVAQHFLFRNPSTYLSLYLRYGDKADFLRPPFSPRWQARLKLLDDYLTRLDAKAKGAHVPFALAFVPQEAQVALMASGRSVPRGIDPSALQKAIALIAARHGMAFADTSQLLRLNPHPEQLYYQVDGHLSGDGQPIAAAAIAQSLSHQIGGAFGDCKATLSARL